MRRMVDFLNAHIALGRDLHTPRSIDIANLFFEAVVISVIPILTPVNLRISLLL